MNIELNLLYCLIYNVLIFNIILKQEVAIKDAWALFFFSSFVYHLLTTHQVGLFFSTSVKV